MASIFNLLIKAMSVSLMIIPTSVTEEALFAQLCSTLTDPWIDGESKIAVTISNSILSQQINNSVR